MHTYLPRILDFVHIAATSLFPKLVNNSAFLFSSSIKFINFDCIFRCTTAVMIWYFIIISRIPNMSNYYYYVLILLQRQYTDHEHFFKCFFRYIINVWSMNVLQHKSVWIAKCSIEDCNSLIRITIFSLEIGRYSL